MEINRLKRSAPRRKVEAEGRRARTPGRCPASCCEDHSRTRAGVVVHSAHAHSRRPQSRFRRCLHVLWLGEGLCGHLGVRVRPRAVGHRNLESRRLRWQVRGDGDFDPRLRVLERSLHSVAARRQHGIELRPGGGRQSGRAVHPRRCLRGGARPADHGLPCAEALPSRCGHHRLAVRPDPGNGATRRGGGRPVDSRRPAHLRRRGTEKDRGSR